jgi:S1-C subfamily serine protease
MEDQEMTRTPILLGMQTLVAISAATFALSYVGSVLAEDSNQSASAAEQAERADDEANRTTTADQQADSNRGDSENQSERSVVTDTTQQAAQADQTQGSAQTLPAPVVPAPATPSVQGQVDANAQDRLSNQNALDAQNSASTQTNLGAQQNSQQLPNAQQPGQQEPSQQVTQQLGIEFDPRSFNQHSAIQANQVPNNGLVIRTIQPNSLFFNSGLRQGDVLLSIDNRPILNQTEFGRLITTYQTQRIPLLVQRDGQQQTIYFNRPANFAIADQPSTPRSRAILGVTFDSAKGGAAVVRAVIPGSPAELAGMMPGDVITALDGEPVLASHEVVSLIASKAPGEQISVDFVRQQSTIRAQTVLAARSEPVRHSVGYAPQPVPTNIYRTDVPRTNYYYGRPVRPGDADRDGRVWDGDGRLPRRAYRNR